MNKFTAIGLAVTAFVMGSRANTNTFFDFCAGSEFDNVAIGAEMVRNNITMRSVDIIGQDGTLASTNSAVTPHTNIYGSSNGLGIDDVSNTGAYAEDNRDFNPGEGWVFSFDADVHLVEIVLDSADDDIEMTMSSSAFPDIILAGTQSGDTHELRNLLVEAGTEITIQMTSGSTAADTGVQIGSLTVIEALPDTLPQALVYTSSRWLPVGCRTLDTYEGYTENPDNMELSTYGGWKARRIDEGTGFFRVEQIDGRWWAVDPEGYLYIHKALNTVNLNNYSADEIYQMMADYGFNGLGCWSDEDILDSTLKDELPLAYCPKISFIGEYRRDRDPRIEMPVFDEEFEAYCDELAEYFLPYVDDPHVFGLLSDNELPWRDEGLPVHAALTNHTDLNYITATNFLAGRGKTVDDWDTDDQYAYMALMAERYYSVVSAAIRKVDPNHMYIGSRCNSTERQIQAFMENVGKYVDVFSMNHYSRWGARDFEIHNMSEWSGRPLMVTEFYGREEWWDGADGAGWSVYDQDSRAKFYQNYVTTLMETGDLVGWHWFKFQDASNGNQGVLDIDGNPYTTLLDSMEQLNSRIYDFIDYIDTQKADDTLQPSADAYFDDGSNYGSEDFLQADNPDDETYLRFDLSGLGTNIASAKIRMRSVAGGSEVSNYRAELVSDNSWGETTISSADNPESTTVLALWGQGGDVEIDVTDALCEAQEGSGQLSLRIFQVINNGKTGTWGSRENTNSNAWPELRVTYTNPLEPAVFEFLGGSEFDQGVVGTTMTRSNSWETPITITTVNIIGQDGTSATNGVGHKTNVYGSFDALGINDAVVGGTEYSNFNPGEAWQFTFSTDVYLVEMDLASQDAGAELTVYSDDFPAMVLADGQADDVHSLSNVFVQAGTVVTIDMTSPTNAADTGVRITSLSVQAASDENSYSVWTLDNGLVELVNDDYGSDPDEDGMNNLAEYALGGNPLESDAGLYMPVSCASAEGGTNWLNCVYRRRIGYADLGLTYTVGAGTNLVLAPLTNSTAEAGAGSVGGGFESVTNRISMDEEDVQFMQLKITVD